MQINFPKFLFLLIGTFIVPGVSAASYTHRLNYNHVDNGTSANLYGEVTFNDQDPSAQQNFGGAIDSGFTTSITYYYQPTTGGTTYVLETSDFTEYRLVHNNAGSTDYDGDPTLFSQVTRLQFTNEHLTNTTGEFFLNMNEGSFLQAKITGGLDNDFNLASTTLIPAPLPLLGILPAFSSIRRLKKRHKKINK